MVFRAKRFRSMDIRSERYFEHRVFKKNILDTGNFEKAVGILKIYFKNEF